VVPYILLVVAKFNIVDYDNVVHILYKYRMYLSWIQFDQLVYLFKQCLVWKECKKAVIYHPQS